MRLAIEVDRRLTVRELENDLGIPKTTVWEISNKVLGITRVCAVTGKDLTQKKRTIQLNNLLSNRKINQIRSEVNVEEVQKLGPLYYGKGCGSCKEGTISSLLASVSALGFKSD